MTDFKNQWRTVVIAGIYAQKPNPDRRWWQVWKPKMVASDELQTFTVKRLTT